MKLRSAEADPHVIKRATIFEHRSIRDWMRAAPTDQPPRRSAVANRTTKPPPGQAPQQSHTAYSDASEDVPPQCPSAEASKPPSGPSALTEASETVLVQTSRRAANFKALLRRRVRRITPPLPAADARSFHGLCSSSRSFSLRTGPALPSRRPLRVQRAETRIPRGSRAHLTTAACRSHRMSNRDPFAGSPPS
jgi:hypothetical protein